MMRAAATGEQREVWQQLGSTLDDHLTIKIIYNKIRIIKTKEIIDHSYSAVLKIVH